MNWFLKVIQNYVGFSGRARRKEYWMFYLFYVIFYIVAAILDGVVGTFVFTLIYSLGLFLPSLAVLVRRLHDTNRSGWWVLLLLLPIIGAIVIFIFTLLEGTKGDNNFGSDPKLEPEA